MITETNIIPLTSTDIFDKMEAKSSLTKPQSNHLRSVLRPSIFILNLIGFGLPCKNKCATHVYNIYTFFMISCPTAFAIRLFMTTEWNNNLSDPSTCLKVTMAMWSVQALLSIVSSIYVTRSGRVNQIQEMWSDFEFDQLINSAAVKKRRSRLGVSLAVFTVLCTIPSFIFSMAMLCLNPPFADTVFFITPLAKVGVACAGIILTTWLVHAVLYFSVSFCAITVWKSFGEALGRHTACNFCDTTNWTTSVHDRLTDFVEYVSQTFGFYALTQLAFSVPNLVMDLYVLALIIPDQNQLLSLKIQIFSWALAAIAQTGIVCYAAYINSAATEVSKIFYKIYVYYSGCKRKRDASSLSEDPKIGNSQNQDLLVYQKATILLSRMQSEVVSVTVWDLAPVTKAFMLTIISVMFNYFFLLLQFAQQNQISGGHCNGTQS